MDISWLVLLPPVLVMIATYATQKLNPSLLFGVLVASFIARQGKLTDTIIHAAKTIIELLRDWDNLYLYLFLIMISILIILLERTGGALAFAHALTQKIRNRRMTETSSLLMSSTLFIDDYLSILGVGYVMRPIADQFKIPRIKLAFLIHTMSSPLVILVPLSSWIAMLTANLDQAGISSRITPTTTIISDPFSIYLQSIPFIFYSILMVISAWFIVRRQLSFGPMHRQEEIARTTGDLFGNKPAITKKTGTTQLHESSSVWDLILPLSSLMVCVLTGILYVGNFYLFGGKNGFIQAIQETKTPFVLAVSGLISLLVGLSLALYKKQISAPQIPKICLDGFNLIKSAILMLILVSAFGLILKNDLRTGEYLANILLSSLNVALIPVMFYGVACLCSVITGSSWGTISILVPIAVPMLVTLSSTQLPLDPCALPLLLPLLGAIFSGAICGDHLSPISQTTVMATTIAGCYPLDHINSQFPYALPALFSAALGFLIVGFLATKGVWLSLLIALASTIPLTLLLLWLANFLFNKQRNKC